ncbi:AP-3 complex subunit sigma-1 isoform X4 [Chiloscyllium punctatum]|uniref:AP-3 complex subunit sigma-1 isoform X4 n=1 Tax=Chiloscyllium punctatum TaxID=137246 RepID=UPI003B63B138
MIKAILIFNNHGKPRLSKFYERYSEDTQQQIIRETFHLVSKRDENVCNFLEGGMLIGGADNKLIYRHYATLYFVFCVDSSESELGILDLIQVFVETLDKCFENVCELDLIFHVDKVHNILAEMVMGGMVLETNMNEIVTQIDAQNKMEKSEAPTGSKQYHPTRGQCLQLPAPPPRLRKKPRSLTLWCQPLIASSKCTYRH